MQPPRSHLHDIRRPPARQPRLVVPARALAAKQPAVSPPDTTRHLKRRLAKTAHKAEVLSRTAQPQPVKRSWPRIKIFRARTMATGLAMASIVALTGYVSVDTWLTNRKVEAQFVQAAPAKDEAAAKLPPKKRQAQEGKDETPVSSATLANYAVAPSKPRAIYIDKLGVSARLLPVGVNPNGNMQAPLNIFDAGWYTGSSTPTQPGAVVVNAHASGPTRQGLFAYIETLGKGDTIAIETGDKKRHTYKVVSKQTVSRHKVDMKKLMLPHGTATEGLNLMTCTGKWEQSAQTYSERVIVYTERA